MSRTSIGVSSANQLKSLGEILSTFSLHQISTQHTDPGDDSGVILSLLDDIMSSHNEHVTYTTE